VIQKIVIQIISLFYVCSAFAVTDNSTIIKQIEHYLNTLTNVSAQFIQRNHNEAESSGAFILSDTKNVRWEYKKPRNIVITFCNKKISYHDKDLNNKEIYSIDNPFVEFIATRPIRLESDKHFFIKEIKEKNDLLELLISNTNKSIGHFILVFNKEPISLNKLVLFDDFGMPIEISFYNLINYTSATSGPLFYCETKNE
jgi:outer membrane lipoprotein-sorting protein